MYKTFKLYAKHIVDLFINIYVNFSTLYTYIVKHFA